MTLGPPTHQVFEILSTPFIVAGRREGWTLLIRNTTDASRIQQMAQQQDRLAAVGQLAAGIAHDFNNIMAAIILYSEMLLSQPDLSGRSYERLTTILQQAQRASGLTRQVLDFSRRSVMEQHPTTLVPFLKELHKLLARTLPESISLRLDFEDEDVIVNADPSRLQQVFMNLALNARDAMPGGGELRFHLGMLDVSDGEVTPSPGMGRGRWVCITVSDTGEGIPAEALPHVFEPFYTTKDVGAGTGLGLAQVYGIVQQHGGHILVWSERGQGTQFSIYLPVLFAAAAPAQAEMPQPVVRGHSESVLVVEDDPATREGVRQVLEFARLSRARSLRWQGGAGDVQPAGGLRPGGDRFGHARRRGDGAVQEPQAERSEGAGDHHDRLPAGRRHTRVAGRRQGILDPKAPQFGFAVGCGAASFR